MCVANVITIVFHPSVLAQPLIASVWTLKQLSGRDKKSRGMRVCLAFVQVSDVVINLAWMAFIK